MAVLSPFTQVATSSKSQGEDFELPSPGTHPAVLVGLIDIGTHLNKFPDKKTGKIRRSRKILYLFELTAEVDSKGSPFVVVADYTYSLNELSNQRKMIETWTGTELEPDQPFDPFELMGRPCILTLMQGQSAQGKKFMEIANVSPLMRGMNPPTGTIPPFGFHLSYLKSQKDEVLLPEWVPRTYGRLVVDDIKTSDEFLALDVPF